MYIHKGMIYYRVGTNAAVRVIVVARDRVICANLDSKGGKREIPYEEFNAAYTLERISEPPAAPRRTTDPKYRVSRLNKYDPRNGDV